MFPWCLFDTELPQDQQFQAAFESQSGLTSPPSH